MSIAVVRQLTYQVHSLSAAATPRAISRTGGGFSPQSEDPKRGGINDKRAFSDRVAAKLADDDSPPRSSSLKSSFKAPVPVPTSYTAPKPDASDMGVPLESVEEEREADYEQRKSFGKREQRRLEREIQELKEQLERERREREQQQEKAAPARQPSKTHHSGDTRRDRAQIRFEEPQQDLRLVVEELSNVVVKLSERLSSNQGRGNREEPKPNPARRSGSGRDQNEGNDGEVRVQCTGPGRLHGVFPIGCTGVRS